ncbi:unnamed protein product [Gongylonema pulchrum]|uniref:Rick_17kDa_Anti domain-containing protein n=1 Tax=Gongylonema pulchrum TaxID=637853 RepID=A0A183EEG9_9BILA|nr:unnamed protein product [Gongylonema pulchrum]
MTTLTAVILMVIPALCTAATPVQYPLYPNVYGYQQHYYNQYQHYQPQSYTPYWSGIGHGFRNYIYPAYQYLPSVGGLLKSGAYGALKGAGVGAAVGGIAGLIG